MLWVVTEALTKQPDQPWRADKRTPVKDKQSQSIRSSEHILELLNNEKVKYGSNVALFFVISSPKCILDWL